MGSRRFSLVAEFEMGGVQRRMDVDFNWTPGEDVIDQRVLERLREWFQAGADDLRDCDGTDQGHSVNMETPVETQKAAPTFSRR